MLKDKPRARSARILSYKDGEETGKGERGEGRGEELRNRETGEKLDVICH